MSVTWRGMWLQLCVSRNSDCSALDWWPISTSCITLSEFWNCLSHILAHPETWAGLISVHFKLNDGEGTVQIFHLRPEPAGHITGGVSLNWLGCHCVSNIKPLKMYYTYICTPSAISNLKAQPSHCIKGSLSCLPSFTLTVGVGLTALFSGLLMMGLCLSDTDSHLLPWARPTIACSLNYNLLHEK